MSRSYHGSRRYEPAEAPISRTRLMFAWMIASAKRRLKDLWRRATPPTSSHVLLRDGQRHFSQLGGAPAKDSPFPTQTPMSNNNWRVLP